MGKSRRGSAKKYLRWAAFGALGAVLLLLFGSIYITRSLTWSEVYSFFGLRAATAGAEAEDGEPSFDIKEGELVGKVCEVSFLAVGQGDCAVIRAGGKTAIIDAGDANAARKISSWLEEKGVTEVEYVFATHPHADHIGSMSAILNRCKVGKFIMTHYPDELAPTNYTYLSLLRQLGALGVPTFLAGDGETFELGGGVVTVLLAGNFENLNDCSLIMRYDFGESSFLFMGDAGFEPEQELLSSGANIKSDVIKIGHHGSRYSTAGSFLAAVAPRYAVITCGEDNQYGYPSAEAVYAIEKQGAKLLRTDMGQDVVFTTDGNFINVNLVGEKTQ